MKVKFLRDYHGPETNEFRHLEGAKVEFPDGVAENLIGRKIVISIDPVVEDVEEAFIEPEIEQTEPVIEVVKPVKIVTKSKKK